MKQDTIEAAYQIVRESVFIQLKNARNLDTKIGIVAGFNMLLLILCWQIYPSVQNILFLLGVGLLVASFILLLKAYGTQDWVISPNPQALIQELEEGKEIKDIYRQTIGDIGGVPDAESTNIGNEDLGAYRLNEKRIYQKARLFNISTYILLLGLILIGLSRISFSLFSEAQLPVLPGNGCALGVEFLAFHFSSLVFSL